MDEETGALGPVEFKPVPSEWLISRWPWSVHLLVGSSCAELSGALGVVVPLWIALFSGTSSPLLCAEVLLPGMLRLQSQAQSAALLHAYLAKLTSVLINICGYPELACELEQHWEIPWLTVWALNRESVCVEEPSRCLSRAAKGASWSPAAEPSRGAQPRKRGSETSECSLQAPRLCSSVRFGAAGKREGGVSPAVKRGRSCILSWNIFESALQRGAVCRQDRAPGLPPWPRVWLCRESGCACCRCSERP